MNIYLAATSKMKNAFLDGNIDASKVNVLESFYSIQPWQIEFLPKFKNFLLDSGAFTFLNQRKSQKIDFNKYADEYAEFIVKYNITKYFELDIDSIVGLDEVEKIRERIERQTKIKSIPVWHKNRGKQYFIDMCKNYQYVSLGGIALKEIQISIFENMLPFFGKYYFAYIPQEDGRILGISKVARVVGYCAARLQLQERLARDIIEMLTDALDGKVQGMAIVMRGKHLCKTMRGVRNDGMMTVAHLSGVFKTNADARVEFYRLIDEKTHF